MSLSAVTNPATASWPAAQPLTRSAGPGIEPQLTDPPSDPPLEPPAAEEAVASRLTSQTSSGRTSESSRITRSQSKRLSARLVTVATRWSRSAANWV